MNGNIITGRGESTTLAAHKLDLDAHTRNYMETFRVGGYKLGHSMGLVGTVALVTDRLYASLFVVERDITINGLIMEVTTLAGGTSIRLGIYNVGANFAVGTRLNNGDTINSGGEGVLKATFAQALTKGVYFLAFISDGTPTVRTHRVYNTPLGMQDHALSAYFKGGYYKADSYGNLPDPFPDAPAALYNILPTIVAQIDSND